MGDTKEKPVCKQCDVEMNHHAEKLVVPVSAHETSQIDPQLGGIIQEIHTCPDCGETASRTSRRK